MSSFSLQVPLICQSYPVPAAYVESIQISSLVVFALHAKRSKQLLSVGWLLLSSLTLKLGSVALSAFRQWFLSDRNHREWLQARQMGFYSSYAGPALIHIVHSFTCTLFCWGWHGDLWATCSHWDYGHSSSNKYIALCDSKALGSIHAAKKATVGLHYTPQKNHLWVVCPSSLRGAAWLLLQWWGKLKNLQGWTILHLKN